MPLFYGYEIKTLGENDLENFEIYIEQLQEILEKLKEKIKMRLLNINCYAEGYYSGATYEENITIPADTFDSLPEEVRNQIRDLEIGVGELDGKHSECFATITEDGLKYIEENDVDDWDFTCRCDGDQMYYELKEIFKNNGIDIKEEIRKAEEYENSIDSYIIKEYRVKKSWVDKINEFMKTLGE